MFWSFEAGVKVIAVPTDPIVTFWSTFTAVGVGEPTTLWTNKLAGAPVNETLLPIIIVPFAPLKFIVLEPDGRGAAERPLPVLRSNSDLAPTLTL